MVYMEKNVIIKVKPETRRRVNIIAAKRGETVDETINYLINFEYKRKV